MIDSIDLLNERLKEVSDNFKEWKEKGFSTEILTCWLIVKMKISRKAAEKIINTYEQFFEEVLKKGMLEKLDGD